MFDRLPMAAQAGFWGSVAGGALVLGAAIGYWARLPQRLIAAVMAYGSGVLISALAFDLMDEAWRRGGFAATAAGFVAGLFGVGGGFLLDLHFRRIGEAQTEGIARWDGTGWRAYGDGLMGVSAVVEFDGRLTAVGSFTHSGSTRLNGIARWDGSTWRGFAPVGNGIYSDTDAAALYEGELWVSARYGAGLSRAARPRSRRSSQVRRCPSRCCSRSGRPLPR